ncbi:hypothetical protein [Actinomadura graeca]|uniref:hypothetical protein n=1 Tax=Actinomadura graeca TaxID=2750812 RepID=UPI001E34D5E8|nr:hypothetical protein [Actinomadura graeca]
MRNARHRLAGRWAPPGGGRRRAGRRPEVAPGPRWAGRRGGVVLDVRRRCPTVSDVVFVLLTVALFALIGLLVRGVERL